MKVKIKKLNEDATIPKYQTSGASGFDFHTTIATSFYPMETIIVKTGLAFSIPEGYELQIRPRSGVSLKTSLRVVNSPGTVDSDFSGEVGILIQNIGSEIVHVEMGYRIAQGIICPVVCAEFDVVDELETTERGSRAYGSTGV